MLERLGASVVCVMNVSGSDPERLIRMYGDHVLPNCAARTVRAFRAAPRGRKPRCVPTGS